MTDYLVVEAIDMLRSQIAVPNSKLQEPDVTAALVTSFPELMKNHLNDVKFGSCFIHQKPYVKPAIGNRCELGDLLVVCHDIDNNKDRYNAVLFQLKNIKNNTSVVQVSQQDQLTLYTEWPIFTIGKKFDMNNYYNITPKTVTSGAQYLFINENSPFICRCSITNRCGNCCCSYPVILTNSIPASQMENRADMSFGHFLWDFIRWQTGRPVSEEKDACKDEWSRLIWSVINITMHSVYNRRNVNISNAPRTSKGFLQFMTQQADMTSDLNIWMDTGAGKREHERNDIGESGLGAISILYIDLASMYVE